MDDSGRRGDVEGSDATTPVTLSGLQSECLEKVRTWVDEAHPELVPDDDGTWDLEGLWQLSGACDYVARDAVPDDAPFLHELMLRSELLDVAPSRSTGGSIKATSLRDFMLQFVRQSIVDHCLEQIRRERSGAPADVPDIFKEAFDQTS